MQKKIQVVDESRYIELFTKIPKDISAIAKSPIRVYKMEVSAKNIKTPTTTFRASFNCITLIKKGHMKVMLDNEEKYINEKSLLISKTGYLSSTLAFSKNITGYFLAYDDGVLEKILSKKEVLQASQLNNHIQLNSATCDWLIKIITLIEDELSESISTDIAIVLFQSFYKKILSLNNPAIKINDRATELTIAFKELVHQFHIREKHINFYSKKLAVSSNYLTRCIKLTTEKTPKQLLQEKDVQYSKLLIMNASTSLSDIANELNYNDPSYFSRLFKKTTGVSPSEYKQSGLHYLS